MVLQVRIQRPDATARHEILKVHARGKPIDPDVDLQQAGLTEPFSDILFTPACLLELVFRQGHAM